MSTEMSDLEKTRLCAEAMGLSAWIDGRGILCLHDSMCSEYEPLVDDHQAMALVKRLRDAANTRMNRRPLPVSDKEDTPRTDAAECGFTPSADPFYEGPYRWVEASFARSLERLWRTAEAAREKLEQEVLAIQSETRTPKADERLARLQRRADHIRNRPPMSEGGKHRDKAECSALDWIIARETHRERELQSARKDERERCAALWMIEAAHPQQEESQPTGSRDDGCREEQK